MKILYSSTEDGISGAFTTKLNKSLCGLLTHAITATAFIVAVYFTGWVAVISAAFLAVVKIGADI